MQERDRVRKKIGKSNKLEKERDTGRVKENQQRSHKENKTEHNQFQQRTDREGRR